MPVDGKINRKVNTSGFCIYNLNYKNTLPLVKSSLDILCSFSDFDDMYSYFEVVYYAVSYVNMIANLKCEK